MNHFDRPRGVGIQMTKRGWCLSILQLIVVAHGNNMQKKLLTIAVFMAKDAKCFHVFISVQNESFG